MDYLGGFFMRGQTKLLTALSLILVVMIVGLIMYGAMEPKITINSEFVSFSGMYSKKLYFKDITEISMKDTIPEKESKIVGTFNSKIMKGKFVLEGLGKGTLFVKDRKAPAVYIFAGKDYVIINYKEPDKTKELYDSLMSKWKK